MPDDDWMTRHLAKVRREQQWRLLEGLCILVLIALAFLLGRVR